MKTLEEEITELLTRHGPKIGAFAVIVLDKDGQTALVAAADAGEPADLSSLYHLNSEVFLSAFARISGLPHYAARRAMEGLLEGAESAYADRVHTSEATTTREVN